MSKYIIDIEEKPLCVFDEDTQTYFPRLWRVKGFNSLVFDEEGLSRLEELNSDYINEHFGDLQDTAYQRGLEEGKKATFGLVADASGAEYQKGFEDGKAVNDKGCEGCKYEGKTGEHLPCDYCMNNFKNQWTAKDKYSDIIRNGIHNWVTELNVKLDDIASILEEMRHD